METYLVVLLLCLCISFLYCLGGLLHWFSRVLNAQQIAELANMDHQDTYAGDYKMKCENFEIEAGNITLDGQIDLPTNEIILELTPAVGSARETAGDAGIQAYLSLNKIGDQVSGAVRLAGGHLKIAKAADASAKITFNETIPTTHRPGSLAASFPMNVQDNAVNVTGLFVVLANGTFYIASADDANFTAGNDCKVQTGCAVSWNVTI
jgi:hypothetical protein